MESSNLASITSIISAVTALVALIVSPLISLRISKKIISATVVSNQSKEWISELRLSISKLMSLIMATLLLRSETDKSKIQENFNTLTLLHFQILLMLTLENELHTKLDTLIKDTIKKTTNNINQPLLKNVDYISENLQMIAHLSRLIIREEISALKK